MPKVIEGAVSGAGLRFAIVAGRYNEFITNRLLSGALEALTKNGVREEDIHVFKVPGSFEIPQMARKIAEQKQHHAIICLGALIRGKTLHFELISNECARGIQRVAADFGLPVTFGVITSENTEQAVERAGDKSSNKGWEAAMAALEMANAYRHFE
ncbi:MAG TPA: 6,7-dimethyl-8-ribityllumazine synthase [Acidobacteriota bacterium]|nr:6,7-dimethyl-8-ribityllumazine synthase [Acidobacteriota bacterium]